MKAYLLSLNDKANISDQWDFGLLHDTLQELDVEMISCKTLPSYDRAVVVIPARHHAGLESKVNKELNKISHVVLFLMGDEEADFDIDKIEHPSIHIWVQNPHIGKHDNYNKLGTGYPKHMRENLPDYCAKEYSLYFAGQVTHNRREELVEAMELIAPRYQNVKIVKTEGFTQGVSPKEYYQDMAKATIALCPSGAVIPDSFRTFEALECMALVIADNKTPAGESMEYWDWLFEDIVPFPKCTNWFALPGIVGDLQDDYPHNIHNQTAWYLQWKRKFKHKIVSQYG